MEVVFVNDKYDATNDILEILKSKDLYVENKEEVTEPTDQITDEVTQD